MAVTYDKIAGWFRSWKKKIDYKDTKNEEDIWLRFKLCPGNLWAKGKKKYIFSVQSIVWVSVAQLLCQSVSHIFLGQTEDLKGMNQK